MRPARAILIIAAVLLSPSCRSPAPSQASPPDWVLVVHGGAGVISRDSLAGLREGYLDSLEEALTAGSLILEEGGSALDAVEAVITLMEDDARFNAGKGAVFTWDGDHELDASIMDGAGHRCGAVTGVTTVRNPIRLARLVMERSDHVLLAGEGAEEFAGSQGVERVANDWFDTDRRRKALENKLGTVGCVALDRHGNLAAGTSTGGLTGKRFGRVGDSPLVGAGTWADNGTCAVSCTGTGEEFIRYGIAQRVGDMMEYGGLTLAEAADLAVHHVLKKGDGGLIALGAGGEVVMTYNTLGMFRGVASSDGRFQVSIWDEPGRSR